MAGRYAGDVATPDFGGSGKSDAQCKQEAKEMMPKTLSKDEKEIWMRVCVELIKTDRMKALFVDALQQYCYAVYRMNVITAFLEKDGYTYVVKGRNGEQIKNRPEIAQRNAYFSQWNSLVAQFGLSPAVEKRFITGQGDLFDKSGGGWGNYPDSG